jgi:hypothetical protein
MHRHLHRVRSLRPAPSVPRPAKVVQLEARRLARLESARPHPQPPKAA